MTKLRWRDILPQSAIAFVGTAALPRVAYWMRWPTRLGPRGFLAYAAVKTLSGFAIRTWLIPFMKRMAAERERAEKELREQLGREPTEDEILAHLGITARPLTHPLSRFSPTKRREGTGGEQRRGRG